MLTFHCLIISGLVTFYRAEIMWDLSYIKKKTDRSKDEENWHKRQLHAYVPIMRISAFCSFLSVVSLLYIFPDKATLLKYWFVIICYIIVLYACLTSSSATPSHFYLYLFCKTASYSSDPVLPVLNLSVFYKTPVTWSTYLSLSKP